jgi:hypothetical protein
MTPSPQSLTAASAPAPVRISESGRDIELDAYSIEEFCRRHSISRGTYYNMKADGSGPRETRAMGRVLITKEAAQEWRERVTQ